MLVVAGARPNFMKVSALWHALSALRHPFAPMLVHTGQHYDYQLSQVFYRDLDLPPADFSLGVGSGSHAEQTARVMIEFERVCLEQSPGLVVVVGDVNSTLACALVAAKLGVPVAHVEAGLRSFDRSMPEEINRVLTDAVARFLFTPSRDAVENLRREGVPDGSIFFVGNVMVDTLLRFRQKAEALAPWREFGFAAGAYGVVTLHRPANVDNQDVLLEILEGLSVIQDQVPLIFPAHPRTAARIRAFGLGPLVARMRNLRVVEPLGYLQFLSVMGHAQFILTDSGGIQEETTMLGVPCLTLRVNTERPVTLTGGTNRLVRTNRQHIIEAVRDLDSAHVCFTDGLPEFWDGRAAERIVSLLAPVFS